jgi:hypothetical protein
LNRRDLELVARGIKRLAGERNGGQSKETVAEVMAETLGLSLDARLKFFKQCGVLNEPAAI